MRKRINPGKVNIQEVALQIKIAEDREKSVKEEVLKHIVRSEGVSFKVAKNILKKRVLTSIKQLQDEGNY